MTIETLLNFWNMSVGLSRPTLSQLKVACGLGDLTRVNPDLPYVLYAGDNRVVTLSFFANTQPDPSVQKVTVIFIENYFKRTDLRTSNFENLEMYGIGLSSCATGILNALKAASVAGCDLETVQGEGWGIYYGKAVFFKFIPLSANEFDPSKSRLSQITFNFGPDYLGTVAPTLVAR